MTEIYIMVNAILRYEIKSNEDNFILFAAGNH